MHPGKGYIPFELLQEVFRLILHRALETKYNQKSGSRRGWTFMMTCYARAYMYGCTVPT